MTSLNDRGCYATPGPVGLCPAAGCLHSRGGAASCRDLYAPLPAAGAKRATDESSRACSFVYGEGTYAEIFGDITAWGLPPAQLELAQQLRAVATARRVPLVGVYVGGRDRLLCDIDALLDAHLLAFVPGPYVRPAAPEEVDFRI